MKYLGIFLLLLTTTSFAAELKSDISCPSHQSATSKTCGKLDYDGNCIYFNESTITGHFCGEAQVCARTNYYGDCMFFNVVAACGDHGCTKTKTCAKTDYGGRCVFFNEEISCR